MSSQQPLYDQLQEAGVAVIDRCEPESENALEINQRLEEMMRRWEKLQSTLNEKEEFLSELLRVSLRFFASLQDFNGWLTDAAQKLDALPSVSSQPDTVLKQKHQLQVTSLFVLLSI